MVPKEKKVHFELWLAQVRVWLLRQNYDIVLNTWSYMTKYVLYIISLLIQWQT